MRKNHGSDIFRLLLFVSLLLSVQALAEGLWVEASAAAPWQQRCGHATVVFDGKLWLIGGYYDVRPGGYALNDVWCSVDGVNWTQVVAQAAWSPRWVHGVAAFAGRLWVLGGYGSDWYNDVWYSEDGVSWTQATEHAPWSRRGVETQVFDSKLWVIGGGGSNDVWYSLDGISWTAITASAPWSTRSGHATAMFDSKLWVFGGNHSDPPNDFSYALNDVWYTSDGVNWTQATSHAWPVRSSSKAAVFESHLWVSGGDYIEGYPPYSTFRYLDDVWRSVDRLTWTRVTEHAEWGQRSLHSMAVFDGKLWLLAGQTPGDGSGLYCKNDIWYLSTTGEGEGEGDGETAHIDVSPGSWIEEGSPLTLTAVVPGLVGNVTYQWTKDTAALPDKTANPYGIDALTLDDAGWYNCQVTDEAKALHDLPPVLIQVFPEGSLPVGGIAAFAALSMLTCVLIAVRIFVRKRRTSIGRAI